MGRKGLHVAVVPTLLLVMNRGKRKEGNDVEGGGEGGGGSLTSKIRIMFKCRHLQQKPLHRQYQLKGSFNALFGHEEEVLVIK